MNPQTEAQEYDLRAVMARVRRDLAYRRQRELEREAAEQPDREQHMAMIIADEESRRAAEAAREAREAREARQQPPRPDKPSEAAFYMMFDGYSPEEIDRECPGVSMLGTRGLV